MGPMLAGFLAPCLWTPGIVRGLLAPSRLTGARGRPAPARSFCATPFATATRAFGGNPHPWALWGLWHLPAYFGPLSITGPDATFLSTGVTFVEYLIGIIGFSFVMSWVFNNTGAAC